MVWDSWPEGRYETINGLRLTCLFGRVFDFDGFPIVVCPPGDLLLVNFYSPDHIRACIRKVLEIPDGADIIQVIQ